MYSTIKHVTKHKHHVMLSVFGTFAIIKMVILGLGAFDIVKVSAANEMFNYTEQMFNAIVQSTNTTPKPNASIEGIGKVNATLTGHQAYRQTIWGSEGIGSEGIRSRNAIAIGPNNLPYIANSDGQYITVRGFNGSGWYTVGGYENTFECDDWLIYPSTLAVDNNNTPYIMYNDTNNGTTIKKYDGTNRVVVGSQWFTNGRATNNAITFDNQNVPYIAYKDDIWLYVMKFDTETQEWTAIGDIISENIHRGFTPYWSVGFEIYDNVVYIAYQDSNDGLVVKKFDTDNQQRIYVGEPWICYANKACGQGHFSFNISTQGTLYIAYMPFPLGRIYVMQLENNIWTTKDYSVGIGNFWDELEMNNMTPDQSSEMNTLQLDNNGIPYITFHNFGYDKLRVIRLKKGNRETVGTNSLFITRITTNGRITPDQKKEFGIGVMWPSIWFNKDNDAYIAYQDGHLFFKTTVKKLIQDDPEGTSVSQRYKNGGAISGATQTSYRVTQEDENSDITYKVTSKNTPTINTLSDVLHINALPIAQANLTGTATINSILRGSYTYTDTDKQWRTIGQGIGWPDYGRMHGYPMIVDNNNIPYMILKRIDQEGNAWEYLTVMKWQNGTWTTVGQEKITQIEGEQGVTIIDEDVSLGIGPDNTLYIAYAVADGGLTVRKYNTSTNQWENAWNTNFGEGNIGRALLVIDENNIPYITYYSQNTNRLSVMTLLWTNERKYIGNKDFTQNISDSSLYDFSIYQGTLYIAFADWANEDKITVMKHEWTQQNVQISADNPIYSEWTLVGWVAGISTHSPTKLDLNIDTTGNIYIMYTFRPTVVWQTEVIKFNGTTWQTTMDIPFGGDERNSLMGGMTPDQIHEMTNIIIDKNGTPYVVFHQIFSDTLKVLWFDGDTRNLLGAQKDLFDYRMPGGMTPDQAKEFWVWVYNPILYISPQNDLYIQYIDGHTYRWVTLKKFTNDKEWSSIFKRYRNGIEITGSTNTTYTTSDIDAGKTITFEVTPIAQWGSTPGIASRSLWIVIPWCGDGKIQVGETCDDGINNNNVWYCNATCNGRIVQQSPQQWWWGGGGWGGGSTSAPANIQNNTHESAPTTSGNSVKQWDITWSPYSTELNNAYLWTYAMGMTTMPTIQKADMDGKLIRKHLAKMITEFAINILKMKPDQTLTCSFTDIANESKEMQLYIKTACQLKLMWWEADGKSTTSAFNPNMTVTRAQFGTVLSRTLYKDAYNTSTATTWYQRHLEALKEKGIMTKIDNPTIEEIRGYVMLMFMRSIDKQ